jgi:hypothetical protein
MDGGTIDTDRKEHAEVTRLSLISAWQASGERGKS